MATLTDSVAFSSVEGKTALVTGASSGIGRIFSLRLAKQGANVIVAARRQEKLKALVEEITAQNGKAQLVELDVSGSEASIDASIEKAWEFFGGIDILVNNAGVADTFGLSTAERTEESWNLVMGTNVRGPALVTKAVTRRMIPAGKGGSIINISSNLGLQRGHLYGGGVYSTSKAAILHLTEALALELGPHKIRVNAISPGLYPTEMTEGMWDKIKDAAKDAVPLQRWGQVDPDLTAPLLLLASDSGAYITGSTIVSDGGYTLGLKSFFPG